MEKTIKLRSQFLSSLNEALQKLNLNDKVTKFTPVIVEADGKFTSIVKTDDTFDPSSLNNNVDSEEENDTPETKETKQQLLNKATDSLKQTLKNSKELEDILKKIKDLAKEDGYNDWVVNKQGNTASLKSKNAYIFKQNDNLCLSHSGKVELFKSVNELRKWLEDNNYPLPKSDVVIHESTLNEMEFKKKVNPELQDYYNLKTQLLAPKVKTIEQQIEEQEKKLEKLEKQRIKLYNKLTKDLDLDEVKNRAENHIKEIQNAIEKKAQAVEDGGDKITAEKIRNDLMSSEEIKRETKREVDSYPERYCMTHIPYQNISHNISLVKDYINTLKRKLLPEPSLEQKGLGKRMDPELLKARPTKDPIFIKDVDVSLEDLLSADDLDECFAGVGVANLGSAVQYLGNKKKEPKKKNKKEQLEEKKLDSGVELIPGRPHDSKYPLQNYIQAFIRWFGNNYEDIVNGKYGEDWENLVKKYSNIILDQKNSLINKRKVHGDWPQAIKDFKTEYINNVIKNEVIPDLKAAGKSIPKNIKALQTHVDEELTKENPNRTITLKEIEDYLKKRIKGNFNTHLYKNEDDTIHYNELSKLIGQHSYGNQYRPFWEEWKNNSISGLEDRKLPIETNFETFENWLNNSEDIKLLKSKGISPNNPEAKQILALLKSIPQTESTELNIFESVKDYPWLNNLLGQSLKEDDSPADFAKGSPISSDTGAAADTGNPGVSINSDSSQTSEDPSGIDFAGEAEGMPGAGGFGDVDISVGGGDYGPEGDEQQMPMPNMPEYQIIDVLVNDDDPSDIKVKVQNVETKEVEIKDLDEIDV